MTDRENLFRPIHKGIRAMIYELGRRLGATDFTSVAESEEIASQLKHELVTSPASCILCLLYAHSRHEEQDFFTAVAPFDRDVVDLMLAEHREVSKRVFEVANTCDELLKVSEPARRIELGDRLNLEANDLFALYLTHLNNEEATLVPVMWERFTDDQLRALRAQFYNRIPVPRFMEWMRWTLPALNAGELTILLRGMMSDPPPNRFREAIEVAQSTLSPDRWSSIRARVTPPGRAGA